VGEDHVRGERGQLGRVPTHGVGIGAGPSVIDPHVLADGPARLLQALRQRRQAGLRFRIVRRHGHEYANAPHPLALLRARRQRPCRRAP
jgi:hypothetical protein